MLFKILTVYYHGNLVIDLNTWIIQAVTSLKHLGFKERSAIIILTFHTENLIQGQSLYPILYR